MVSRHRLLVSSTNKTDEYKEHIGRKVIADYRETMLKMREMLASSLTDYDMHAMGVGIAMLWLVSTRFYIQISFSLNISSRYF